MKHSSSRTGGQVLVDTLVQHGVSHVFCVAGESYIAALDALYDVRDKITVITCRHESGAAFMAEAYGKLTGKPGICFVTRGPGACNASIGIHTAFQDQTPLILLIGQVGCDVIGREGFQEVDYRVMYGALAKWATQIESSDRIPEMMNRAFALSQTGRPGPVVIALPENVLSDETGAVATKPAPIPAPAPDQSSIAAMTDLLNKSTKPFVILGGGGWTARAVSDFQKFAESNHLPVAVAFRRQDLIDNNSPSYIGDINFGADAALVARMKEADVIFAIGDRIGEVTSREYSAFSIPQMGQKLIHVQPNPDALNHVYRADVAIAATMPEFCAAVRDLKLNGKAWQNWAAECRKGYEAALQPTKFDPAPQVDLAQIMQHLNANLPKDAIIANDAGNYAGWLHRYYQWKQYPSQLGPGNGAMGYGVPAAIAASLVHPNKVVVGFVGDGGFMMTGQEMATAIQHGSKPIICVVNNGMYGTIRMHQEKYYPGRTIATDLHNPDFAALARSYGAFGAVVKKTEDFAKAFDEAKQSGKLALIEIQTEAEIITNRTTISAIRKAAGK
ncbi:MAG: thiamine pyrophosphate-binding protein [Alphaproteobacteria bacterium]|nr:MAG: thiamine pyrophosphate-binding protein [Alphaproteobacteria bacterium]